MRNITSKQALWTLAFMGALATSSITHAASYRLHQGGFSDGGNLDLTFQGLDEDQDGFISSWDGEVSQAFLSYSGSNILPTFTSGLIGQSKPSVDLVLKFKVGESGFGDDPSLGMYVNVQSDGSQPEGKSFKGYAAVSGGKGFVAVLWGRENSVGVGPTSLSPLTISQVPEPGTFLSMAVGLASLSMFRRRQGA
ncbi:MAG: PEP-CTERM sorting domain-containing protein [Rubrivivax sp.]|nr:MAG: PEP-CTERM sorting domain-containing protein [Rubrivivax sp.]